MPWGLDSERARSGQRLAYIEDKPQPDQNFWGTAWLWAFCVAVQEAGMMLLMLALLCFGYGKRQLAVVAWALAVMGLHSLSSFCDASRSPASSTFRLPAQHVCP